MDTLSNFLNNKEDQNYIEINNIKNCNIISIDNRIKKFFSSNIKRVEEIQKEVNNTQWIYDNIPEERFDAILKLEQLEEIKKKYSIITGQEYVNETEDIIRIYKKIQPTRIVKIFGQKNQDIEDVNENEEIRKILVNRYINISKKYYNIRIIICNKNNMKCDNCGFKLMMIESYIECNNCGLMEENIDKNTSYDDMANINVTNKFTYDRNKNFEEAVYSFQGKQNKKIPDRVFEVIDNYFLSYKINRKKIDKELLQLVLRENKLSIYYDKLNYLLYHYTSEPLPDISHLERRLFRRYEVFNEVYEEFIGDERSNALYGQYLLWSFLIMEKHKCNPTHFSMLQTREVIIEHDKIMERMVKILATKYSDMNWKFTPLA
jgi:hypothetical protein